MFLINREKHVRRVKLIFGGILNLLGDRFYSKI